MREEVWVHREKFLAERPYRFAALLNAQQTLVFLLLSAFFISFITLWVSWGRLFIASYLSLCGTGHIYFFWQVLRYQLIRFAVLRAQALTASTRNNPSLCLYWGSQPPNR